MTSQLFNCNQRLISSNQAKYPYQQQSQLANQNPCLQLREFASTSVPQRQQITQMSTGIVQGQTGQDPTECFKKVSACLTRETEEWKQKYEILEKQTKEDSEKLRVLLLQESKEIIERELAYQKQQYELDKEYLQKALTEAEMKLAKIDIQQSTWTQQYNECTNALKQKEKMVDELQEELQIKEASNQQYLEELKLHYDQVLSTTEERVWQLIESQFQSKIDKLMDEIEAYKQQISNYEFKFDNLNQEIINLKQQLIEKTNSAQEWEQKYYQMEKKLFGLSQTQTTHQTKQHGQVKEFEKMKEVNLELAEQVKGFEKEIDKIETKLNKKKKKYNKLECEFKKMQLQKPKEIEIIKEVPVVQEIIKEIEVPIEIIKEIEKPVEVFTPPQIVMDNSQQQQIQALQSCHCQLECEVQQYKQAYEDQIMCCDQIAEERDEYQMQCERYCQDLKRVKELFIEQDNERNYLIQQIHNYQQCLKDFDCKISCKNSELMKNINSLDQQIGQSRFQFSSVCRPDHAKIQSIEDKVSKRMHKKTKR